jgi:maltooligosyltrehalose trehalohydrolase
VAGIKNEHYHMNYKKIFPVFSDNNVCEFRIWAPKAKSLHLVINGQPQPVPMNRQNYGYWSNRIEDVSPGLRYKYQINDAESYPDPASLSQPDGVHGASEAIDLRDFQWDDNKWKGIPLKEMIQYELHPGTFTPEGNFSGVRSKIEYLKHLGVNTIELLPVAQFSGQRNWGYDGVYPFAVQNIYGGAKGLMELVNECHRNELAVILDVVYNHFGPEGNYSSVFGYYFSGKYSTPWGQPVNFDGAHSDAVRNFVVQNALMWCRDFRIDGLRLDAVHAIYDFSAKHIMQELAENIEELGRETGREYCLVAESNLNDVRYIKPVSSGGYGLDGQWSDDFHHAVHTLATGEKNGYYADFGEPGQLSKAIKDAFIFDGVYSKFRRKTYGNSTRDAEGGQFVIFSQNHDQVGNRLHGDRLISSAGFELAKVIAATMFLAPNVPMLFMGEEYGERNPFYYFVSHLDPELNRLVREGRKKEFSDFYDEEALDPDDAETFEASKLSWNIDDDDEKKGMFGFYREMIRLRKSHQVLRITDKDNLEITEHGKVFHLERWQGNQKITAFLNYGDEATDYTYAPGHEHQMKKILDSGERQWNGAGNVYPEVLQGQQTLLILEKSVVIYSTK